jgi:hypothetical protein
MQLTRGATLAFSQHDGVLRFRAAGTDDVARLVPVNAEVKLDMRRHEQIFSPGADGFEQKGGFFEVMDAATLARCVADERSVIFMLETLAKRDADETDAGVREAGESGVVACAADDGGGVAGGGGAGSAADDGGVVAGNLVATLWVSLDDPAFDEQVLTRADAKRHSSSLSTAQREGRLCYARELITVEGLAGRFSRSAMIFYGSFSSLSEDGFTHALSEVYRIVSVQVDGNLRQCAITNRAGLKAAMKCGGVPIGFNQRRTLALDEGVRIVIEPLVVLFELAEALAQTEAILLRQKVEWGVPQ